ncbi:MAG: STAS domain-containing protein [Acidimicrobiia bacterium]|nr:STAS domain-containing protein [Acidimicrobiia bacterium]
MEGIEAAFRATADPVGARVRVRFEGELDEATTEVAWSVVETAAERDGSDIELDLSQVTFMSSVGLAVLIRCQSLVEEPRRLVLVEPSPIVRRVLTVTDTAQLFEIEPPDAAPPAGDTVAGAA